MFFFASALTFILSYLFFTPISNSLKVEKNTYNLFFLLSFVYLFIFIYFHFIGLGTDTIGFYNNHFKYNVNYFPIADNLIYGINHFLVNYFNLSFESISLLSFFPRFMCTLLLISLIDRDNSKLNRILLFIILIFPTLNFFSTGLNKDMLIYCSLSIFLFSLINEKKILFIISLILIFLVRPYVVFVILFSIPISLIIYILFSRSHFINEFSLKKFSIFILSTVFIIFSIYFISDNLLGSFGKSFLQGNFSQIINSLQGHYLDTPLAISNDLNIFIRVINYLFYPSLWNPLRYDLFFLIMIIENFFLLLLIIYFVIIVEFNKLIRLKSILGLISFLFLLIMLSLVTSNLGIAFRQKWMIIPFLLILIANNSKLFNFESNFTNKKISKI